MNIFHITKLLQKCVVEIIMMVKIKEKKMPKIMNKFWVGLK